MAAFITVSEVDFNAGQLLNELQQSDTSCGAIVNFIGLVRDVNENSQVQALTLEHYPGMTEKVLGDIAQQAQQRFGVSDVMIYHRVGTLALNEQIVFVATNARHREAAFAACQFVMDFLKRDAPFWKCEQRGEQRVWLGQADKDKCAHQKWDE